jgi:hypothetical protein
MASATATRFKRPLDPSGSALEAARRDPSQGSSRSSKKSPVRKRGCPGGRGRRGMHRRAACRKQHRSFVRSRGEQGSDRCDGRSEPPPIGDESMDHPRWKARVETGPLGCGLSGSIPWGVSVIGGSRAPDAGEVGRQSHPIRRQPRGHLPDVHGEGSCARHATPSGRSEVAAPQLHLRVRHLDGSSRSGRAPRFRSRR